MLRLIDKKKLFFYLIIFILLSTQIGKNPFYKKSKYKVNQIKVYGLTIEENLKISKNLNSLLFKNIFFLEKDIFSEILFQNNIIEDFSIKKIYPNIINVDIKKTEFLGITKIKNKKYYIGSNAKLILVNEKYNFTKKLPFVYKQNNYSDFIKLKEIIDESKIKFEDIESFYYFPNNRWNFKTKKGVLIKLPEKEILKSLETVFLIESNNKFKKSKTIDLRLPNNIIISNE